MTRVILYLTIFTAELNCFRRTRRATIKYGARWNFFEFRVQLAPALANSVYEQRELVIAPARLPSDNCRIYRIVSYRKPHVTRHERSNEAQVHLQVETSKEKKTKVKIIYIYIHYISNIDLLETHLIQFRRISRGADC